MTRIEQRLKTLTEFRTMSVQPFPIQVYRDNHWSEITTDALLPGDLVSITRTKADSGIPCDLLLLKGTAIVNEAMLSGESTPLLKESVELREGTDKLDYNGIDRNSVLFSGTKALQVSQPDDDGLTSEGLSLALSSKASMLTSRFLLFPAPDQGCLAVVLKTGFGTTQGQLVRTMIFSDERMSANNLESFVFIGFLLIFAIAASAYVWIEGRKKDMDKGKLLLDVVLVLTSVVPPELPMELTLAVNASLVALSKYGQFLCHSKFDTLLPVLTRLSRLQRQPSSVPSHSGFRSLERWMFVVSTRLGRSPARTSLSRVSPVLTLPTLESSFLLPTAARTLSLPWHLPMRSSCWMTVPLLETLWSEPRWMPSTGSLPRAIKSDPRTRRPSLPLKSMSRGVSSSRRLSSECLPWSTLPKEVESDC
jgi:hypothetical protein